MWLPRSLFDLFTISKDTVEELRVENLTLRTERDLLKSDLLSTKANFSWLTMRVNDLEKERGLLLEKAYGIKKPVPEIGVLSPTPSVSNLDVFEDMGDVLAKKYGLPDYSS